MHPPSSDPLADWKAQNQDLAEFIHISESTRTLKERVAFRRRQRNFLNEHRANLSQELQSLAIQLSKMADEKLPISVFINYDFPHENLTARKLCAVRQMIQERMAFSRTELYATTRASIDRLGRVIRLLETIPTEVELEMAPKLLSPTPSVKMIQAESEIQRLRAYEKHLSQEIERYVIPMWHTDFPQFIDEILCLSFRGFMPDLGYIPPQEAEVSLSRCFFARGSRYAAVIDNCLAEYGHIEQAEFVKRMLALCYSLMPKNIHVNPVHAPLLLLFIYRTVFNRFYETHEHVFVWKDTGSCEKVAKLAQLASTNFSIPLGMVESPSDDVTISELFTKDHRYDKAIEMLESAFFVTTPLDVLFKLHQGIISIQNAALNFVGKGESVHEVMSFDDLFSLLFGVFLGSQVPDLPYLEWFVVSLAPIQSLSPPLDYALANLEALCKHLKAVELVAKSRH